MRQFLLLLLSMLPALLPAQTIIELGPGGNVRGKTVEDYRNEVKMAEIQRQDSLQYIDHLRRAFNALCADSLDEAEQRFNQALKLRPHAPGNYVVRYNLALIDMARGQNRQAIAKLTPIINDYPLYYDARLARAEAELHASQLREAVEDAEVLLSRDVAGVTDDTQSKARFIRAAARYGLRLYPEARLDVLALLKDRPDNENAQLLDALILQRTGQPGEALNRLNLIVEAHPQSIDALTTRAGVLTELEKYALAKADYDALIERVPGESEFYIQRAKTLINIQQKAAARRDLDMAVKLGVSHGAVQPLYNLTR